MTARMVRANDRRTRADVEVRDPRGATQRVGWTSPTLPQVDEWHAEQAFRLGYSMNVIAYRCVQLRARASASVPFVAGSRMSDATSLRPDSPLAKFFGPAPGGPAPKMSASKLFRWTHAQKIVTGRRAWEIETDAQGRPVAFWPLASAFLKATPSAGGTDWFRVFEYGTGPNPVKFKPEDVFYGWDPSGVDFRQAESEMQALRFDLSLINLCDRHSIGFLRNNAVPAAIVTTTAFPDEASRRKFIRNWSSEFSGPENAGRVALNEVGDDGDGPVADSIDVKVLGLSAKDARLVEQRKDLIHEVAIGLGTPFSKLDASGRTFENADAEDRDWWENTILPELTDLQDDINMQIAPRLGSEVGWFDLRNVRALKRRSFAVLNGQDLPALVDRGIILGNEIRADASLPPIDGLDVPQPVTADPAVRVLEVIEQRMAAIEERTTAPAPVDLRDAVMRAAEELLARRAPVIVEPEQRVADPDAAEQRRVNIWRNTDATVRTLEGRWQRAWAKLFARQLDSTLSRLTGKRGRQALTRAASDPIDAESVFSRPFWTNEAADLAAGLYEDVAAASLAAISARFGISFDVAAKWVADFIEARANKLAGQVTQTTYEAIQAALNEGVAVGESIDDLAGRIRTLFAQTYASRAETVARTEVISAYNGAGVLGATQLPPDVVAGQEWIATRDGRTREEHAAADGQIVGVGTAFDVGGHQMAYPGDPNGGAGNVVNCFPADTVVASHGVEGSYRRWYDGPMVTISTISGRVLTGTPNHPVLTDRGWVALGELHVGDHAINCDVAVADISLGVSPHVQRAPSPIGQVHDTLALMGASHRVAGGVVDFHGDGREGEVDVVRAARHLQVGEHAAGAEQARQLDFAVSDLLERALSGNGFARQLARRCFGTSPSGVGGQGKRNAFLWGGVGHAESHGGTTITRGHPGLDEAATHAWATEPDRGGDGLLRFPGDVAADEIIDVDVRSFAGHVYNLQTASGWYIANGIVAHNCRCTIAFLTPDEFTGSAAAALVPAGAARAALGMVRSGEHFDEARFRRALEAAA